MSQQPMAEPNPSPRHLLAYRVSWHDDIAVFRFGDEPLFFAGDLKVRDELLKDLDRCAQSLAIRVVVLIGFPEKAGSGEYERFYREARAPERRLLVNRMLNVFNQFILAIVELDKLVIFVNSGRVISQFLNVGLACDYRIIGDNTVIEKAYLRHGLLPKGGGALLLSRLLGRGKALELLLSPKDITAEEALLLGLANEVAPAAQLELVALRAARRFAALPPTTVTGVKRLLNYDLRGLSAYLDFENHQILLSMRRAAY